MAHAQTHDNVQFCPRLVEQLGLEHRVAGHGAGALVGLVDAQLSLKNLPGFAPHAEDLKTIGPEHLGQDPALSEQGTQVAMPILW